MSRRPLPGSEERRGLTLSDARVEIRSEEGGDPRFFGHACVFNRRAAIGNPKTWGFFEQVAPGACAKTISERDVAFLIDHSSAHIVARTAAGDLHLHEDDIGLATDADLDLELSYVRDLRRNLEKRRITGMSFGFFVPDGKEDWTTEIVRGADGSEYTAEVRTIREIQLVEVSAVSFPAYAETDAAVRALRSRGDVDAIARRAQFRPELARLLDEVDHRKRTHIVLNGTSDRRAPAAPAQRSDDSPHLRRIANRVDRTAARLLEHATRNNIPLAELRDVKLPWFEVRSVEVDDETAPEGPATVLLYDEIGGSFGTNAKSMVKQLNAITADEIHLRINSPGGSVFDALAIQNALRSHAARVTAYVDGIAASAASVVAMGADEVVMMPGAQMMIHDASAMHDGNAADMAKMVTFLDRQSDNIAGLYALKGGGDAPEWRTLMRSETWMFDHEAVSLGLADRVEPVRKKGELAKDDEELLTRSFDLSGFRYEGRAAAPAPERRGVATPDTPEDSAPSDGAAATPEPGESTQEGASKIDSPDTVTEPAETIRTNRPAAAEKRMSALQARFSLPATAA